MSISWWNGHNLSYRKWHGRQTPRARPTRCTRTVARPARMSHILTPPTAGQGIGIRQGCPKTRPVKGAGCGGRPVVGRRRGDEPWLLNEMPEGTATPHRSADPRIGRVVRFSWPLRAGSNVGGVLASGNRSFHMVGVSLPEFPSVAALAHSRAAAVSVLTRVMRTGVLSGSRVGRRGRLSVWPGVRLAGRPNGGCGAGDSSHEAPGRDGTPPGRCRSSSSMCRHGAPRTL